MIDIFVTIFNEIFMFEQELKMGILVYSYNLGTKDQHLYLSV